MLLIIFSLFFEGAFLSFEGRIERQMRNYSVWRGGEEWQLAWDKRVKVVDGDVTLPRLGLTDTLYESLAVELDAIIHGAAHVNFIYPYEALRATNVLGIHEIIQFAFYKRINRFTIFLRQQFGRWGLNIRTLKKIRSMTKVC